MMDLRIMSWPGDRDKDRMVKYSFGYLLETSSRKHHQKELVFEAYTNKDLCVVHYLEQYKKENRKTEGGRTEILYNIKTSSWRGVKKHYYTQTIAGWTKEGLPALKARCEELQVQPRGTRGESGGQTGITYDISNKHRLGYSEVELVQKMIDGVNTLWKEDKELVAKWLSS